MSLQKMFEGYENVEFSKVAITADDLLNKKIYLF